MKITINELRKTIRGLLSETMRGPEDLPYGNVTSAEPEPQVVTTMEEYVDMHIDDFIDFRSN